MFQRREKIHKSGDTNRTSNLFLFQLSLYHLRHQHPPPHCYQSLTGSPWLSVALRGSLWLCLVLSGSIALRDCLKVLVWLMIASLQHLSSALSNILDKWDLWNILTKITPGPFGILCSRRQSYAREGHCIKRRGLFKICI